MAFVYPEHPARSSSSSRPTRAASSRRGTWPRPRR